jgi:hypothetical protein
MTTLDPASAQTYRVYFPTRDEWVTARPLLSAAGVKPVAHPDPDLQARLEAARDRVHLSPAGQQAADAVDDTTAKAGQVYTLMQQLRDEVERIARATPEPTPYAVFTDNTGRVVGKIYQDGGVWFNSDEAARVGGTAGIRRISDQVWSQTNDGQVAKRKLFDAFSSLLAGHDDTRLTLTGTDTTPAPFQPSARLLDLADQIVALNPQLADNFSQ